MADPVVQKPAQQLPAGFIGQMPVVAKDSSFQIIGIRPGLQHTDVVIGLQKKHIQIFEVSDDIVRVAAHIRRDGGGFSPALDPKAYRLRRVMRDFKGPDQQVSDGKCFVRVDDPQKAFGNLPDLSVLLQLPRRPFRRVNRQAVFSGEDADALDMVAVLVGDKHRVHVPRRTVDGRKAALDPNAGNAGVHQNRAVFTPRVYAIPAAPARNAAKFHINSRTNRLTISCPGRPKPPKKAICGRQSLLKLTLREAQTHGNSPLRPTLPFQASAPGGPNLVRKARRASIAAAVSEKSPLLFSRNVQPAV